MFGHGKCPRCEQPVDHCELDQIVIGNQLSGRFFHGASACCPKCHTVLGVFADPSALASDIAQQTTRKLKGRTL
jgi:hypothetical protein